MTRALTKADLAAADAWSNPSLNEVVAVALDDIDGWTPWGELPDEESHFGVGKKRRRLQARIALNCARWWLEKNGWKIVPSAPSEPARIGLDLGEMPRRRWWEVWKRG